MIAGKRIRLRNKSPSDAYDDYSWHIDPELAELDATTPVKMSYERYLLDYVDEMNYPFPSHRRFAIETTSGKHIGNCAYYGIDETKGEAEIGIMIGNRDYWDRGYGTEVITTLVDYIFGQTALKRLHLKTLEWNTRAQKCFLKCGFTPHSQVKRGKYQFVLMEMFRGQWEKNPDKKQTRSLAGDTGPGR